MGSVTNDEHDGMWSALPETSPLDDPTAIARRVRAANVPLHALLGFEFFRPEKGSRIAEVRMPVREESSGHGGHLHGGAIATLVDLACAVAAARATSFDPAVESLVTADLHVRYLRPARLAWVVAVAEVIRIGSQLIVIECKVHDSSDGLEHGALVATADFSMMRVALRDKDPKEAATTT